MRRRFRWSWWYILLLPLLVPIMCLAFLFTHFTLQCLEWRAPLPWPYVSATVTTEHITASMSSDSTTTRYLVDEPTERIERYYTEQMQQLCRPYEITPFATVNDPYTGHISRRASCLVRGRSIPTPNGTPNQFENDMTYRAEWYEAIKGTQQIFRVDLYRLTPTQLEVVQFESLSCP
jgi:hypothetical protein